MSNAGLVRYFEEDQSNISINPRTFLALLGFVGMVSVMLQAMVPYL